MFYYFTSEPLVEVLEIIQDLLGKNWIFLLRKNPQVRELSGLFSLVQQSCRELHCVVYVHICWLFKCNRILHLPFSVQECVELVSRAKKPLILVGSQATLPPTPVDNLRASLEVGRGN